MLRVLITGSRGLLAPYLVDAFAGCDVHLTARSGGQFPADLRSAREVRNLVDQASPDVVVHAAALTDVEKCESNPGEAFDANAMAASILARALPSNARLVLLSTDQVYSGDNAPHREGEASPVNSYGRSKLAGEWGALASHRNTVVVRTNFFGISRTPGRESLSDFFVRAFAERTPVNLFEDAIFSPLCAPTLAGIIRKLAVGCAGPAVLNVGSRDGLSKAEFARRLAIHKRVDCNASRSCISGRLPGRAPRPLDLRLDVREVEAVLGESMPALDDEIRLL